MKTVGVIGGMGPAATADFFSRLVRATDAKRDQDHLHVIIDNDPAVPDRNLALAGRGPSSGPAMAAMARRLHAAGADFLVIACNTAHAFIEDVQNACPLPVIDLIDVTTEHVTALQPVVRRVGLLATDGCLSASLYQRRLDHSGRESIVLPEQAQRRFMNLIYEIKEKGARPELGDRMALAAETLVCAGAELIVAACTEVPLVLEPSRIRVPLINSLDLLVGATLRAASDAPGSSAQPVNDGTGLA